MLDENLPTFFLTSNSDDSHNATYYLTRGGSDPLPAYTLKHADPSTDAGKNCYAAALFDAYNPEVLFGEVLIRPQWTHPSLSADEIRRNGGVAPPPEPLMPNAFTIQLYNPDLQIEVRREHTLLGGNHYDFAMPTDTFRAPSASMLDRTQNDPGAAATTNKIHFTWKRDSKLSKDMGLFVRGKSTDLIAKKKNREPDIAVAQFKSLKDLTVLEPNLYRVEMEDAKGLEVVMVLTATVIRDVFFGQIRTAFNVTDTVRERRRSSAARDSDTTPALMSGGRRPPQSSPPATLIKPNSNSAPPATTFLRPSNPPSKSDTRPPITDPRTQWEIDAETARLRAAAEAEARDAQRASEARRREQQRQADEEAKRVRRMVEAEAKERQRRQREADKETERLRRIYGVQGPQPDGERLRLQGAHSAPIPQAPFPQQPPPGAWPPPPPPQQQHQQYAPQFPPRPQQQQPPPPPQQSPYLSTQGGLGALSAGASLSNLLTGGGKKKKGSWSGQRSAAEDSNRLQKKSSSVW